MTKTIINNITGAYTRNVDLVGKIEYLTPAGKVCDHTEYDDIDEMLQDVKDELEWDVAISVTLYGDHDGKSKHTGRFDDIVDLLHGFRVTDTPKHIVL
jgi:hypothetical protein